MRRSTPRQESGTTAAKWPARLALLRHPAVAAPPGLCYGRLDVPLASHGLRQAGAAAARLGDFAGARLWTSPARRCCAAAEIVAAAIGTRPTIDRRLEELCFGDWEGRRWDSLDRAALDRWAADPEGFAAPGGETGRALIARVRAFFAEMAAAGGAHVVVSHGGPLRVLTALAAGREVDLLAKPIGMGGTRRFMLPRRARSPTR
jgi:alpha-ribazole phosphatase